VHPASWCPKSRSGSASCSGRQQPSADEPVVLVTGGTDASAEPWRCSLLARATACSSTAPGLSPRHHARPKRDSSHRSHSTTSAGSCWCSGCCPCSACRHPGGWSWSPNPGRYRDTLDLGKLRRGIAPHGLRLAGSTQFANDILAIELASRCRGTSLEVTCVNPGIVATDLFRHAPGLPRLLGGLLARLAARVGQRPNAAARVPAWLAADPDAHGISGGFFGPRLTRIHTTRTRTTPERRADIWKFSEELLHALDAHPTPSDHRRPAIP